MKWKVFVTGASGYIGTAVTKKLIDNRHEVIGLTHDPQHANLMEARGVQVAIGDIKKPEQWQDLIDEVDAVIHLAQDKDDPGGADWAAVEAILKKIYRTPKRFVYTSGVWVLGETGPGEFAAENTPPNPIPMVAYRVDIEKRLIEEARTGNAITMIIRPSIVYGSGGGILAMLSNSAREHGAVRFIGSGENLWPLIEVNDLAELYVKALESGETGEIYNAADNQMFTVKELAEAAGVGAGIGPKAESWPLDEARKELGPVAEALVLSQSVSGAKARNYLGWAPKAPYNAIEDLKQGSYAVNS